MNATKGAAPPPLEYRQTESPRGPGWRDSALLRFLCGLGVGVAFSLVMWGLGWNRFVDNSRNDGTVLLFVPGMKLFAACFLLFFRGARAFAAGLLVSIALGALIFFGSCLYHFKL